MAIQILGKDGLSLPDVQDEFSALAVTQRPLKFLSVAKPAFLTGSLSGLAANTPIYSLRNISSNLLVVKSISLMAVATAAPTAPQQVAYSATIARNFTASDTNGTQHAFGAAVSNTSLRTVKPGFTDINSRISAAAALGVGTRTLDSNPIGLTAAWASVAGILVPQNYGNLYRQDPTSHPIVLQQNEGLIITNVIAMGAALVATVYISLEIAEILPEDWEP